MNATLVPQRVIATVVAVAIAMQSVSAMVSAPGSSWAVGWVFAIALAVLGLVLAWRPRPPHALAALTLLVAAGMQAFMVYDDARVAVAVVVAIPLTIMAIAYVAVPLVLWRRGRWHADAIELAPVAAGYPLPEATAARIAPLAALGFRSRLLHAHAEQQGTIAIVVLSHDSRGTYAVVTHLTVRERAFAATKVMSRPGAPHSLSVVDAMPLAPFPPVPEQRLLLFPGADAPTLVDNFERIRGAPGTAPVALSDAELASAMSGALERNQRWLVDAGYLAAQATSSGHRYTLKGAFTAIFHTAWPWGALVRARLAREGVEALHAASPAA